MATPVLLLQSPDAEDFVKFIQHFASFKYIDQHLLLCCFYDDY